MMVRNRKGGVARTAIGVLGERGELGRKLVLKPRVVRIQKCYILSTTQLDPSISRRCHTGVSLVDVAHRQAISLHYRFCFVRRPVVDHQYFKVRETLRQHAVDRLRQKPRGIICWDYYGYL